MTYESSKRLLITGATGGIGRDLCIHLIKKGYKLCITARRADQLHQQAQFLNSIVNESTIARAADFNDLKSLEELCDEFKEGCDGLVLMPPQVPPTSNCLPEKTEWERLFLESFIGPLELLKVLLPKLKLRQKSKVVIISGISSAQVLGHYATSNVLRTAWLGQAKTLAHALGPDGIRINTLSLGRVLTPAYLDSLQLKSNQTGVSVEALVDEQVSNVPLRKYATPAEVAFAIEGLLSDFSDHISGMNILCDGGFTRAY